MELKTLMSEIFLGLGRKKNIFDALGEELILKGVKLHCINFNMELIKFSLDN